MQTHVHRYRCVVVYISLCVSDDVLCVCALGLPVNVIWYIQYTYKIEIFQMLRFQLDFSTYVRDFCTVGGPLIGKALALLIP